MRGLYRGLREGVLLLGVLLLMTAAALAAAPVQQESMTTIVCMGDSLTDAEWKTHQDAASYSYLPAAEQHWTSLIAKELPAKVINKGIARQRTDEMLARFQKDVVAQQPEVCIIWGGANDVLQGKAVPSILRNVRYMIELCQQNNIRPVLVDAPIRLPDDPAKAEQCQRDFALLHEAYKKLAADEKLAFVDLYETKLHGRMACRRCIHCQMVCISMPSGRRLQHSRCWLYCGPSWLRRQSGRMRCSAHG